MVEHWEEVEDDRLFARTSSIFGHFASGDLGRLFVVLLLNGG
jgi:hypothetical protein